MSPRSGRNSWSNVWLAVMAAGGALTLAAWAWMAWASPETFWSLEEAAEYQAAGEALELARRAPSKTTAPKAAADPPTGDLAAAEQRFDRIRARLERARRVEEHWGPTAAGAGLALTIVGGVGYLATRGS